jgi:hypothetical protein
MFIVCGLVDGCCTDIMSGTNRLEVLRGKVGGVKGKGRGVKGKALPPSSGHLEGEG